MKSQSVYVTDILNMYTTYCSFALKS